MGSWQLEVGRMALYVFFPVAAFYYFHRVKNSVLIIYSKDIFLIGLQILFPKVDYFKEDILRIEQGRKTKGYFENVEKYEDFMHKLQVIFLQFCKYIKESMAGQID